MARGPKKHLKRVAAPKSWMMDKLGGVYAVRPAQGPHKLRESIPLSLIIRNQLRLALNNREVDQILKQKEGLVLVDGKVRRNPKFPCGLMDVVTVPKLGGMYRVLYNVKRRFVLVKLNKKESEYKLCRIQKKAVGPNKVCYLVTHDGRTLRFVDPAVEINDTVKYNFLTGEIVETYKMKVNNTVYVSGGNNRGRIGTITHISTFDGNHDLVTIKDVTGSTFTTRIGYVFVIGTGSQPQIKLPKDNGIRLTIADELAQRLK
jgi:small subunit ribosomal protein S4e